MKRFIIEFGMGADFHGQDVTRAAEKAVYDAISRSCLSGLKEVLQLKDLKKEVDIKVTLAVTRPEEVQEEKIKACFPIGQVKVEAVKGGLRVSGLMLSDFGDRNDSIEVALASVEVGINNYGRDLLES